MEGKRMPIYSHSRLSTFETCPLKYKLSYLDRIRREEEGIEAFLGQRFHEAMEKLYRELVFRVMTLKELLTYYEERWNEEYHDEIVINREERTAEDYRKVGRKCIEDYYARYHPFDQGRVLGIEKRVVVDLAGDGKYLLQGYIDRIAQDEDGTYEIHDYKTSGHLPEQKRLDADRQLALYQIGVEGMWNDVEKTRLVWHYVVFDKEMSSTRTEEQLDALRKETIALIDTIESTKEFPPHESALCDWCPYWDRCPKKKHLYTVEPLPPNEYLKDDGVKLVNAYVELVAERRGHKDEISRIEEKMQNVREAVIAYSNNEKVDVIIGSGHKLSVRRKQRVGPPRKGSPGREKLEAVLREAGKWEEVCSLDRHALARAVSGKGWDAGLASRIEKFLDIEEIAQLYLSEIK